MPAMRAGGIFAGLLVLYAWTAAPQVGVDDSAFFALSCLSADIGHAPGYPLFALLCHPFARWLPLNPAHAAAMFSAVCAAAACAMLAAVIHRLIKNMFCAVGGALLFGVSAGFWSQATLPEVYALNALLFLSAFYVALLLREKPSSSLLIFFALLCGLGLSNHWPLFLLAAMSLPFLLWPARKPLAAMLLRPPGWLAAAALAAGLSPYWYLVWRSQHPHLFMGLPFAADDWESFWRIVSRQVHFASDEQGGGWPDKFMFAADIGRDVLWRQFGILGGGLAAAGFVLQWRRIPRTAAASLTAMFFASSLLLIALLNFIYDEKQARVFAAYPLLSYAAACAWAAAAAASGGRVGKIALAAAAVAAAIFNFDSANRRHDTLAADIHRAYFKALPPGAWIPSPPQVKIAKYLQLAENVRPDVLTLPPPTPFSEAMHYGGARLYPPNALAYAEELRAIENYAADKPLCYNTFVPLSGEWHSEERLLFSCLTASEKEPSAHPAAIKLLQRLMREDSPPHVRHLSARIVEDATRTMLQLQSRLQLPEEWKPLLQKALTTAPGFLSQLEFLNHAPDLALSKNTADKMAAHANELAINMERQRRARMLAALAGLYAKAAPRNDETLTLAKNYYAAAENLTRNSRSPILREILNFYRQESLRAEEQALIARHAPALFAPALRAE